MHTKQIKNPSIISMVGREIAGYHSNLQRGFDQLGVENYFFYERTHQFYKHNKPRTTLEKWISALNDFIFNHKNGKAKKIALFALIYPLAYFLKIILFPVFLKKYDVFIFSANYSYFGLHIDRFILKQLNKTTVDIALGSEARPPYLNGLFEGETVSKIKWRTIFKKRKINRKAKYTTYLVDHPTTSQLNTRAYIPLLYIGLPFYLPKIDNVKTIQEKPLILHAPSNPKIKGTPIIRQVIDELKGEGIYNFEYKELSGVPHSEVIRQIQKCSFVINELYSDTLMAGLDTEAAWFGKASIVGGYNLSMVEKALKGCDVPPTYRILPMKEALKKAIIHLLSDPDYCKDLGQRAQSFVKENWSAKIVAQRYLDLINREIPESFFRSPYDDCDIHGCGIATVDRQNIIKKLLEQYGQSSLCIDDKPHILKALNQEQSIFNQNR